MTMPATNAIAALASVRPIVPLNPDQYRSRLSRTTSSVGLGDQA
jgi:hypothetical protein